MISIYLSYLGCTHTLYLGFPLTILYIDNFRKCKTFCFLPILLTCSILRDLSRCVSSSGADFVTSRERSTRASHLNSIAKYLVKVYHFARLFSYTQSLSSSLGSCTSPISSPCPTVSHSHRSPLNPNSTSLNTSLLPISSNPSFPNSLKLFSFSSPILTKKS